MFGDTEKSYAFDIRCERKQFNTLPDLLPLAGAPLSNLNLKRNLLLELPPEGFKGLKFKSIKKKDHSQTIPKLQVGVLSHHTEYQSTVTIYDQPTA